MKKCELPLHRARIHLAPATDHPALTGKTLEPDPRQLAGQHLPDSNGLRLGRGHSPVSVEASATPVRSEAVALPSLRCVPAEW